MFFAYLGSYAQMWSVEYCIINCSKCAGGIKSIMKKVRKLYTEVLSIIVNYI